MELSLARESVRQFTRLGVDFHDAPSLVCSSSESTGGVLWYPAREVNRGNLAQTLTAEGALPARLLCVKLRMKIPLLSYHP